MAGMLGWSFGLVSKILLGKSRSIKRIRPDNAGSVLSDHVKLTRRAKEACWECALDHVHGCAR